MRPEFPDGFRHQTPRAQSPRSFSCLSSLETQDISSLHTQNSSCLKTQDMSRLETQDMHSPQAQDMSSLQTQGMSCLETQDTPSLETQNILYHNMSFFSGPEIGSEMLAALVAVFCIGSWAVFVFSMLLGGLDIGSEKLPDLPGVFCMDSWPKKRDFGRGPQLVGKAVKHRPTISPIRPLKGEGIPKEHARREHTSGLFWTSLSKCLHVFFCFRFLNSQKHRVDID